MTNYPTYAILLLTGGGGFERGRIFLLSQMRAGFAKWYGLLSCLLLLIDSVGGFFCFNSIPLGAAGVALGIIARGEIRSRDPRGSTALATGGMVCSIIGLCIGVLLVLLSIATLAVLIRLLFSYI